MGGGVFSVVLIMAKPCAEGVFVTGKQADWVLVTGLAKLPPPVLEPGLDNDLEGLAPSVGVIALVAPARRRPLVESPVNKHYISNAWLYTNDILQSYVYLSVLSFSVFAYYFIYDRKDVE